MLSIIISSLVAVVLGVSILFVRMKASSRPVNAKKIILPPLFMSTGALMFVVPYFRVGEKQILESILVGMLFSTLLIATSRFEVRDQQVYMKRSKAFGFILIGLLIIRIVGKVILSSSIDVGELGGMFYLLAVGMIAPWRLAMYIQYKRMVNQQPELNT